MAAARPPRQELKLGKRAIASRVPEREGLIRIGVSGPQVGSWAIGHQHEDLTPFGFIVLGGPGPQFTVRVVGRFSVGPSMLNGSLELGLVVDRADFANSFEAVQVAIERLARLPDADHLANANLRIEIDESRW